MQDIPTQPVALVVAMQHYFGRKSNQTLNEFSAEVKQLTPEDKAEIEAGLRKEGYIIK